MKFIIDHDLHIHSYLSRCSRDPLQTTERILQYAKNRGLKRICITDHFWDERVQGASRWYETQNFPHITQSLPLPKAEGVEFLFGCETELDQNLRLGLSKERMAAFDFVVIPTTHLHMKDFTIRADATLEERADAWVKRLDAVLNMDLPFHKIGIAHLTATLMAPTREEYRQILDLLPETAIGALLQRAATCGVGIELNADDMKKAFEEGERAWKFYRIAKECGCRFYLGSDAHSPRGLEQSTEIFRRAVDYLELEEDHKLPLVRR